MSRHSADHAPMPSIALPPGHQYALMWDIPDDFAGMTNSMLHRSRDFVQKAGADVTILTFQVRPDGCDRLRTRLRERGAMIEGMSLRNLWEDLAVWDDARLAAAVPQRAYDPAGIFDPLDGRGTLEGPLVRRLRNREGRILQSDIFRPDGSLLASNRTQPPEQGPRAITLCDRSGAPLGSWRRRKGLYFAWLDSLPRDPTAWMICDSKTSARYLTDYRRTDVVTIHVVRGLHLRAQTGRPFGVLNDGRRYVMEHLRSWDAVIFLTNEQLGDVTALLGPHRNLHVIPNNRPVPDQVPNLDRSALRGAMLASIDGRKQIAHAVKAMSRVGRVGGKKVTLDIWGTGEFEKRMRRAIRMLRAPVRLRGHSPTAVNEFETASFSLLTSRSEALPGVLIESMGRGCIPISYNMPYGPADIITHGVDGFLVPQQDIAALAQQIRNVASMTPEELAPMRLAAYRRAREFADFTGRWANLMNDLAPGGNHGARASTDLAL